MAALAIVLGAAPASAQSEANKSQARELSKKGFDALDHKEWAQAETLFLQADALYHAPTLLVGAARAQARLGKYVEAWENYHRVILEGAAPGANAVLVKAVDDAKAEIDGVAGKRAQVTMTITGPESPTVTLDGVAIPSVALGTERPVNPGTHAVHAEAAGFKAGDGSFSVEEGKSATFSLALEKEAAPPAGLVEVDSPRPATLDKGEGASDGSSQRTLAFVGFGVGAAGIVGGAITGIIAMGKHSDLQKSPCSDKPCSPADASSFNSDLDSYHAVGTISTIGFVVGAAGIAAGTALFLTAPKREQRKGAFIAPAVGLGTVGATGRF